MQLNKCVGKKIHDAVMAVKCLEAAVKQVLDTD